MDFYQSKNDIDIFLSTPYYCKIYHYIGLEHISRLYVSPSQMWIFQLSGINNRKIALYISGISSILRHKFCKLLKFYWVFLTKRQENIKEVCYIVFYICPTFFNKNSLKLSKLQCIYNQMHFNELENAVA